MQSFNSCLLFASKWRVHYSILGNRCLGGGGGGGLYSLRSSNLRSPRIHTPPSPKSLPKGILDGFIFDSGGLLCGDLRCMTKVTVSFIFAAKFTSAAVLVYIFYVTFSIGTHLT